MAYWHLGLIPGLKTGSLPHSLIPRRRLSLSPSASPGYQLILLFLESILLDFGSETMKGGERDPATVSPESHDRSALSRRVFPAYDSVLPPVEHVTMVIEE